MEQEGSVKQGEDYASFFWLGDIWSWFSHQWQNPPAEEEEIEIDVLPTMPDEEPPLAPHKKKPVSNYNPDYKNKLRNRK